jgi:NCAIR mutase (PurE)-related protein
MAFATEKEMVETAILSDSLCNAIDVDFGWNTLVEPRGLFGIPDLVFTEVGFAEGRICCAQTTAIEAKLRNWRKALIQAFRYRSFANSSYVLIDSAHSRAAIANLAKFVRAKIGLLSIDEEGVVTVLHRATSEIPYCNQTAETFRMLVDDCITTDA